MLALNKTTGYAIQALACLDEPGGKPKFIDVIAAETMIPQPYLRKVIRKLSAASGSSRARPASGATPTCCRWTSPRGKRMWANRSASRR